MHQGVEIFVGCCNEYIQLYSSIKCCVPDLGSCPWLFQVLRVEIGWVTQLITYSTLKTIPSYRPFLNPSISLSLLRLPPLPPTFLFHHTLQLHVPAHLSQPRVAYIPHSPPLSNTCLPFLRTHSSLLLLPWFIPSLSFFLLLCMLLCISYVRISLYLLLYLDCCISSFLLLPLDSSSLCLSHLIHGSFSSVHLSTSTTSTSLKIVILKWEYFVSKNRDFPSAAIKSWPNTNVYVIFQFFEANNISLKTSTFADFRNYIFKTLFA